MLNQCNFIGRLGRDPETRYSQSGTCIASFSIACSETWKDKATGEKKEKTEWVSCTVFGRLAEICGEYLAKGALVYVSGKMNTEKWQDKDGNDRYTTKIIVNEMKMLSTRSNSGDYTPPTMGSEGMGSDVPFAPSY